MHAAMANCGSEIISPGGFATPPVGLLIIPDRRPADKPSVCRQRASGKILIPIKVVDA